MNEIMNAIIQNDTNKVFKLVDTSYCFDIRSKEGFMFTLQSLNQVLSKEKRQIIDNKNYLPIKKNDWNEMYKTVFSLNNSDFDSVAVEFSFYTGMFSSVYYFDATFIKNKNQPLDAAPSGN